MKTLKIILVLVLLNVISYWLFSQSSSEVIVNDKYLEFTERRFKNDWNKDNSEIVIITSCGDEFFRNIKPFENTVRKSNPSHKEYPNQIHENDDFYQSTWKVDYHIDILSTIQKHTDSLKSTNCIIYKVCTIKTIPTIFKQIKYYYFYSDTTTDFHIMYNNNQIESSLITYFWLFGYWIELDLSNNIDDDI